MSDRPGKDGDPAQAWAGLLRRAERMDPEDEFVLRELRSTDESAVALARTADLMIRYMHQQLTSAEMIAELVAMAKEVAADARRGERFDPPLNHAELAFYDALAEHGMARALMGDDTLAQIARALVADIRRNLSVDWLSREPVRANSAPASAGCSPASTTRPKKNARQLT